MFRCFPRFRASPLLNKLFCRTYLSRRFRGREIRVDAQDGSGKSRSVGRDQKGRHVRSFRLPNPGLCLGYRPPPVSSARVSWTQEGITTCTSCCFSSWSECRIPRRFRYSMCAEAMTMGLREPWHRYSMCAEHISATTMSLHVAWRLLWLFGLSSFQPGRAAGSLPASSHFFLCSLC